MWQDKEQLLDFAFTLQSFMNTVWDYASPFSAICTIKSQFQTLKYPADVPIKKKVLEKR